MKRIKLLATSTLLLTTLAGSQTAHAQWIDADVGGPAYPGSAELTLAGTWNISGGGDDIWNNADKFFYRYTNVTGVSWDAVMRIHDFTGPDWWSKVDLMVRYPDPNTGLPAGPDPHISTVVTRAAGDNRILTGYRASRGGGSGDKDSGSRPAYPNCWVRVERFGRTFNLYWGTNGTTWTKYDTFDTSTTDRGFSGTPWPDPIPVGVAVTAHNDGSAVLGVATISDLAVTVHPVLPPTMTVLKQVQSVSVYTGTEASFSYELTNSAPNPGLYFPSYQWFKNGQLVTNATGRSFTFLAHPFENGTKVYCQAAIATLGLTYNSATGTVTTVPGSVMYTNGLKVELFRGATRIGTEAGNTGPTVPNLLPSFDIPGGFGDNYAQRVSGWFLPPTSGNYTFFVASDDDADVFLSTDNSAANKRLIAQEPAWSGYRNYTGTGDNKYIQKCSDTWQPDPALPVDPAPYAAGIPLVAGNLYYLETVMRQGGGGDNLSVTYRMFGATNEVNNTPSMLSVTNNNVVIITSPTTNLVWTTQPTNTTVFEGQNATFRSLADARTELAILYQWYRNNAPISGAVNPNYTLPTSSLDNGAQFFVTAKTQEGNLSLTSSVVTLTVQQSVFEPGYVKVEFWQGANRQTIENGTAGDPTYVTTSPAFEAGINNASGDNYGRRLSGFFVPATTARYDFFVNADDNADLFLSTTASVVNKYMLAQATDWADPRKWVSGNGILSQKRSDTWTNATSADLAPYAAGIQLTAGTKYYLEAVQTEVGGGDNVGANIKVHGEADPVDNSPSLLTGSLIGLNAVRCNYVAFSKQPASTTNQVMNSATFTAVGVTDSTLSVGVLGDPRPYVLNPVYVIYQWYKNGVLIPGAVAGTYTTPPLLPTDNGAQFMCKIRALGYADAALKPIWSNSVSATLTVPATVWEPGYAKVDLWWNKVRSDIETGNVGAPDYQTAVAQFGVSRDVGDNYARRFSGFFVPPATAYYTLADNSDDDSDLFLNPTGNSPTGKLLVAQETGWSSGSLQWQGGNLQQKRSDTFQDPVTGLWPWSYPGIPLTGGQKYYLEGVHHEGGGGDYFEATFTLFDDAWTLTNGAPIALVGTNIGMYAPKCAYVAFTQQPQSVTAVSLLPATFSVAGTTDSTTSISPSGPPTLNNYLMFKWFKRGVLIPGANAATLTIPQVMPADSGAQIVCAIRALGLGDAGGNAIWSNSTPAILTVSNVPAAFKYAAYVVNTNQGPDVAYVTLSFDKSMNLASLLNAANYTLAGGLTKTGVITVNTNSYRQVALTVTGAWAASATVAATGLLDAAGMAVAVPTTLVHAIPFITTDVGTPTVDPIFPSMLWVDGAKDYTVVAEGSDFWNNADGGNLSWELKTGNFDVVTRVKSVTWTSQWAKGGLMARETLEASSRNWNIVCDPWQGQNQIEANSRTTTGGSTAGFDGPRPAPTYPNAWVRLARSNNVIVAYTSTNGVVWNLAGSQDATLVGDMQPLPASMYVGLCTTAHNNDTPGVEPYIYWNQVEFADYNSAFVPVIVVTLKVVPAGNNVSVSWTPNAGRLFSSPVLGAGAVWTPAPAGNPVLIPTTSGQTKFFKVLP